MLDGFWVKMIKVVADGNLGPNQRFLKAPQILICVLLNCQHLKECTQCLFMLTSLQVSEDIKTRKCTGSLRRRKANKLINGQVIEVILIFMIRHGPSRLGQS